MISISIIFIPSFALADEQRYRGTLRIGVRMHQYHRLDPRNNTLETMAPASGMIYDCLFNWGPDGYKSMMPQLATSYETKDNKVWIIHLRKGVKFHNGREMTAEDASTEKERIKYYQEAEKVLLKDVACIPMLNLQTIIGYSKKLKGFKLNNTSNMYVANTWSNFWLEK